MPTWTTRPVGLPISLVRRAAIRVSLSSICTRGIIVSKAFRAFLLVNVFGASLSLAGVARAQTVKADHTTVDASALSTAELDSARKLRMNFSHASVGSNIWDALTKLSTDTKYVFPNWSENNRGNPGWSEKVTNFEGWVAGHTSEFDVFQNKFCYIDQDASFTAYRDSMVALAAKYPAKVFVWWTMPLMTDGSDNALRAAFNKQVRDYCKANDLPLYDIADIESHTTNGGAVASGGVEALDSAQSSDGGHLTDGGASRAAQAQWILMAKIATRIGASVLSGTGGASTIPTSAAAGVVNASSGDQGASDDAGCSMGSQPKRRAWTWIAAALLGFAGVSRRRR